MLNDFLKNLTGSKGHPWAVCAGLGEHRSSWPWGMEASPWLGFGLCGSGQSVGVGLVLSCALGMDEVTPRVPASTVGLELAVFISQLACCMGWISVQGIGSFSSILLSICWWKTVCKKGLFCSCVYFPLEVKRYLKVMCCFPRVLYLH